MKTIIHQLSTSNVYIPNWKVKHLFIGTFNPYGGEEVSYYYARPKNQTWKLLSNIFEEEFDPNSGESFFELLKKHKIACIDLIHQVKVPDNSVSEIVGRGYKDSAIINKQVERKYNTQLILQLIEKNPNIILYSTWGEGSSLACWRTEINKIPNLIKLTSPSLAARVPKGSVKFDFMLNNWSENIIRL